MIYIHSRPSSAPPLNTLIGLRAPIATELTASPRLHYASRYLSKLSRWQSSRLQATILAAISMDK